MSPHPRPPASPSPGAADRPSPPTPLPTPASRERGASAAGGSPTGIILAGGRSTRFGSDKASALFRGGPLLQWVADALAEVCRGVVVVRAREQVLPALECAAPLRVVEDVFEAKGPLAGMVGGFEAAGEGVAVVVSCDAPLIQPALLRGMLAALGAHDAACGRVDSKLQPLSGAYDVARCLPVVRRRVESGRLAVAGALDELDVRVVDEATLRGWDPELLSYRGANTPAELAALEGLSW